MRRLFADLRVAALGAHQSRNTNDTDSRLPADRALASLTGYHVRFTRGPREYPDRSYGITWSGAGKYTSSCQTGFVATDGFLALLCRALHSVPTTH
jgi:hypothetical protein